ncbi:MAG: GntR family transcriptional regulator [Clostridiales bacterium]|nr:GntR family transcriptional regulator [Lachnospiraceae bacterium]MCD8152752.1 GntR family transcriptional regulator [Clostridiales bacterium]MCD8324177.1 GntR family transcriptional regulator [Clostridiales bacterium]
MQIEIDFESEEALYIQLRNQIIYGIATRQYREGDSLPSVRQLAETIGINMHTVNKAYAVLRQEGLLRLGRRTGAVIAVDIDRLKAMEEMRENLRLIIARGYCKGVSREEIHQVVDSIYSEYESEK